MKHIEFGKGFYFLVDLQKYTKLTSDDYYEEEAVPQKDNLEFTYNMGELKIQIPVESEKKKDKPQ